LIQGEQHERAVRVIETMQMIAPDLAELWREAGVLHAQLGNMRAAVSAFEQFIAKSPDGAARHEAAVVLQQLKTQLN